MRQIGLLLGILLPLIGCGGSSALTTCTPAAPRSADLTAAGYVELTEVRRAGTEPYDSVCHLDVQRRRGMGPFSKRGRATGTGFLIGDSLVVTAAHNVHSSTWSKIQSIQVRCGRVDSDHVWELESALGRDDVSTAAGYAATRGWDEDYAVIRLTSRAPYTSSFHLLGPDDAPVETGATVHTAGYPGKDPLDDRLRRATAAVVPVEVDHAATRITYDFPTVTGHSGGPVWVERGEGAERQYIVVGIHNRGFSAEVGDACHRVGQGRRVDAAVRAAIGQTP